MACKLSFSNTREHESGLSLTEIFSCGNKENICDRLKAAVVLKCWSVTSASNCKCLQSFNLCYFYNNASTEFYQITRIY